ncbi:hypothetical protein FRX31_023931, partial [Thalictrum thalictroides]
MNIPDKLLKESHDLWSGSLIVTLLKGEHINGDHAMKAIRSTWRPRGRMDILKRGNNLYVCRFDRDQDKDRITEEQPWKVLGKLMLMQPFSADMNPFDVRFNTIPLWMSMGGLSLEHHTAAIVEFIAGAAGECLLVIPRDLTPRTMGGYRARVVVQVFDPLIQGIPTTTVHQGIVYVSFNYHQLAGVYCHACFRLGHDTSLCPLPPTEQQDNILQLEYPNLGITEDYLPLQVGNYAAAPPNTPEDVDMVVHGSTAEITETQLLVDHEILNPNVTTKGTLPVKSNYDYKSCSSSRNKFTSQNLLVQHAWAKLGHIADQDENEGHGSTDESPRLDDYNINLSSNADPIDGIDMDLGLQHTMNPPQQSIDVGSHTVDQADRNMPGIVIREPNGMSTTTRFKGRPPGTVGKGKGKAKIPFQMEEQSRPYKKRKSDAMDLLLYGPPNANNLKEIATMWESMTNPILINLLVANGLLDLSGGSQRNIDSNHPIITTPQLVVDGEGEIDYQMQLALMNDFYPGNRNLMLALPTLTPEFGENQINYDMEGTAELRTNAITSPSFGLEAVVEDNNPMLISPTTNIDNQVLFLTLFIFNSQILLYNSPISILLVHISLPHFFIIYFGSLHSFIHTLPVVTSLTTLHIKITPSHPHTVLYYYNTKLHVVESHHWIAHTAEILNTEIGLVVLGRITLPETALVDIELHIWIFHTADILYAGIGLVALVYINLSDFDVIDIDLAGIGLIEIAWIDIGLTSEELHIDESAHPFYIEFGYTMKFLSWNCRGLANPTTIRTLSQLIREVKPGLVFLSETKMSLEQTRNLIAYLQFPHYHVIPPIGISGGLILIWNHSLSVKIISSNKYIINTEIISNPGMGQWHMSFFHGSPYQNLKPHSWDLLNIA